MGHHVAPSVRSASIRWAAQPPWARFAAMGPDGRWRVFKHCPMPSGDGWIADESYDADGQPAFMADMARPPKCPFPRGAGKSAVERTWSDWRGQWLDSLHRREQSVVQPIDLEGENVMRARETFGFGTPLEAEYARTPGDSSRDALTLVRLRNLGGVRWHVADTGDGLQVVLRGGEARRTFMAALAFILNADG